MIKLEGGTFKINGEPYFINSGEIHYFRIEPELWDRHLEKAVEAGLNTVSTYVPWRIHEPEEGKFDFSLFRSFADTVKKHGLYLIARVGPVSNAELEDEGLPSWISSSYPGVYLKGKELKDLPHAILVAYNNPVFLELVQRWYDALIPIVAGRQISKGGAVSMVQLCNEIGMVHWLNKASDRNSYSDRMYREYLKGKYGDILKLNKAYGTEYSDFNKINQPEDISISRDDNLLPYYDWMYYYFEYFGKYYSKLFELARDRGIEVPVIANIPQFYDYDVRGRGVFSPMTTLMFSEFPKYVPEVVFGGAYQMRRLDYENFQDVLLASETVKMISGPVVASICCELQTGIMRDRPRIYPSDVELNLKTSAASGLNALNGYMFSGGVNKNNTGAMGNYHEWQASVDSKGSVRPHFKAVQQFGRIIKTFGNRIAGTEKLNDVAIGFYRPYYATEYLSGPFIDKIESDRTRSFFDGIARLMSLCGYSYEFSDIQKESLEKLKKQKEIVVYADEFMDSETQLKLAEYVKAGGNLLIYPQLPVKNIKGEKSAELAEELGIKIRGEIDGKFAYIDGTEILVSGKMQEIFAEDSKDIARSAGGQICGLVKNAGRGKVAAVSVPVTHIYDYLLPVTEKLMELIDVKKKVESIPSGEIAAFYREGLSGGFLFAANYQEIPRRRRFKIDGKGWEGILKIPEKGDMFIPPRTVYILPVNVALKYSVIVYSTAEIESYDEKSSSELILKLRKTRAPAEILLKSEKASEILTDAGQTNFTYGKNGYLKIAVPEGCREIRVKFSK